MPKVAILITESPHYDITSNLLIKHLDKQGIDFILLTDNERSKKKFPNAILIEKGVLKSYEQLKWPVIRYIFGDIDRSIRSNINIKINDFNSLLIIKQNLKYTINKYRITHVIFEWPSHSFSLLCKEVCDELNVTYLGMTNARIKNMVSIEDLPLINKEVELSYEELKSIFAAPPSYMEYMKQSKNGFIKIIFLSLLLMAKYFKLLLLKYFDKMDYNWYRNELNFEWRTFKINFIKKNRNIKYADIEKDTGTRKNYIYFMQYSPEASVSILGWRWLSQLHIIYDLLLHIENDSILYIKEHPSQSLCSDLELLRYIEKFPNVKILHHANDIDTILKTIKLSFTVSSTAGFRSLFNEVPVVSLGECPDLMSVSGVYTYNEFINRSRDDVFKVDKYALAKDMNRYRNAAFNGEVYTTSAKEIEKFVKALVGKLKND